MLCYTGYVLRYLTTDTGDVTQVYSLEESALTMVYVLVQRGTHFSCKFLVF